MNGKPVIVWFRRDLRLEDNPALKAALERGAPLIPVCIHDPEGEGDWAPGAASRWWLHHSLDALDRSLRQRGSRLVLRSGDTIAQLLSLVRELKPAALFWNKRYEPAALEQERKLKERLGEGLEMQAFNASLLFEPGAVMNRQGGPFQVFTPFWRHCLEKEFQPPLLLKTRSFPAPTSWPEGAALDSLELLPRLGWAASFSSEWKPGEAGAAASLGSFTRTALETYAEGRDLPYTRGTSRLSPHLHFGEIGPRQIVAALRKRSEDSGVFPDSKDTQRFLAELGWREFASHLLHHFPRTPSEPLREAYARFPWARDPEGRLLKAWQEGRTGYPIVDAGMRELWATGWMHNRVRMIVASFLVKHLLLPWQAGSRWFWDTLVDADLAANTLGWQWSAGCGADAAPYFRIFNPTLQGAKFDPEGSYVRRWVPELARLPVSFVHQPWKATPVVLGEAGVRLGVDYPLPVVEHSQARRAALAALASLS